MSTIVSVAFSDAWMLATSKSVHDAPSRAFATPYRIASRSYPTAAYEMNE